MLQLGLLKSKYSRVEAKLLAELPPREDTGCNRQKRTVSEITQLGSSSQSLFQVFRI